VIRDTTSAFLVANSLQSARVIITGWDPGSTFQGIIGTEANPWNVQTGNGSAFFNINSVSTPSGSPIFEDGVYAAPSNNIVGLGAASPFDSGLLGGGGNNPAPANLGTPSDDFPGDNVGDFAKFSAGGNNDNGIWPMAWLSLASSGLVPPATLNVLRITWAANQSATVSFKLAMNTPAGDINMSITIPPVPGPGALALLGVAGLVGTRRRRA
jgi:MYXO-CTERM domain-containing protein